MSNIATTAKRFHGYMDTELVHKAVRVVETKELKHYIIQEREVSYRLYPHFHPYVGQLVQKLLRKSTAGLQAADTEYEREGNTLPGSVQVAAPPDTSIRIPAGSPVVLIGDLQATLPDGTPTDLTAGLRFKLASGASATVPGGAKAVLFEGMTSTPSAGSVFNMTQDSQSSIYSDTKITLPAAVQIVLHDGTQATIGAGAQFLLPSGAQITLPNGSQVTLVRSKRRPVLYADIFSTTRYRPSAFVQRPYPVKDLDFTCGGAYSVYNWELFFHVPLTIAIHLSKNQRFAEAQRWFHYVFDPTDDGDGPTPERFWKVRPFQTTDVKKIEEILVNLTTNDDPALRNETVRSIEAWKETPFRPHVIARYRQQAYMYKTVMAYLDNLIAWADSLFRQDTGEAIDEAMMLYVLAANILGPRPLAVPKKGSVRPQNYANLRADLKQFGVVMREAEAAAPFDLMPFPTEDNGDNERLLTVRSLGKALYFCVPRNDKLLSYWDIVADRLFKIRNSLNLQGVFRQLALFAPPIDPGLLARAAAAGLDVGAIINGLNQPLPLVRFQLLVQKAGEICQEVKALGNNLLSAMEKEDGEAMIILRSKHELAVMKMVEHVKYAQVQEAIKSREGLLKSLALAVERYTYYERQLGKQTEEIGNAIPALDELDQESLDKMKFAMKEPEMVLPEIKMELAPDQGPVHLKPREKQEMDASHSARDWQVRSSTTATIASVSHYVPKFGVDAKPLGVGMHIQFGGDHIGPAFQAISEYQKNLAGQDSYDASHAAKMATYEQREQEWAFQRNLAAGEINQIFKQMRAAQIREAIANQDLKNQRQQIRHAEEIERFLNEEGTEKTGKKTNKALYSWMKREVKGLYGECFQFAFDIAKKAERALQHECGNPELRYLQFGYLAGKEGLLAGDKLHLDIKRMEMAYHELHEREYELTKHVSLLQVDPLALIQLRATGHCTLRLPESLYDLDGPGHYFRRIKSVALSIPCVTGPYASVNCTLTLLKSSIRKTQVLREGVYARENAEDDRFDDYFGSSQSVVTSSAQNDTGMFDTNLRDERYLPFENFGVISEWQLELPANPGKGDPCQFDYDTISDVIMHIRYTARPGGGLLRNEATKNLATAIEEAQAAGSVRLFSIRHDFPTEWAKFQSQTPPANQRFELALKLRPEHYPFWSQNRLKSVKRVDLIARSVKTPVPTSLDVHDGISDLPAAARKDALVKVPALGNLLVGKFSGGASGMALPSRPVGEINLFLDDKALADLWVAVTWST